MVEERKIAKIIYDGKNAKLYLDTMDQQDGTKTSFYILTIQKDNIGFYRDDKGNQCYGKRPSKAITFNTEEEAKDIKMAINQIK
ncbi:MAG TPA: hypothetical protein VGB37_16405 [Candidatus Lokiarchaeia archaeon]